MENSNPPFADLSGMVTQSFEQNRKAMENCLGFFKEITMASPWFASSDLNQKMQSYAQQNTAAAFDFVKKLTNGKDFGDFWNVGAEFVQAQWKAFADQMKDLSETAAKGSTGAVKNLSS
jgi:hypothetical protein